MAVFGLVKSAKIDFTYSQSCRKVVICCKFIIKRLCMLCPKQARFLQKSNLDNFEKDCLQFVKMSDHFPRHQIQHIGFDQGQGFQIIRSIVLQRYVSDYYVNFAHKNKRQSISVSLEKFSNLKQSSRSWFVNHLSLQHVHFATKCFCFQC